MVIIVEIIRGDRMVMIVKAVGVNSPVLLNKGVGSWIVISFCYIDFLCASLYIACRLFVI